MLTSVTKVEAAYREARRRVLTGAWPPGVTVNQSELASEFGVSPTPIREALRRLENEGLVVLTPHSMVTVAPLSLREFDELYAIRMVLDSFAAALAAQERTDEDVARLNSALESSEKSPPRDRLDRNRHFHRLVYAASGNQQLTTLLDQLWDRTDRYRLILVSQETEGNVSDREHGAIASAIAERDADRAARLVRGHVQLSHDRIRDLIERPAKESTP